MARRELSYISAGVNRYANSVDWGINFIAYAATNSVLIWNVKVSHLNMLYLIGWTECFNCHLVPIDIKGRIRAG